jgi:hypothetical protein
MPYQPKDDVVADKEASELNAQRVRGIKVI